MNKTLDHYLTLPYRMEIIPDADEGGYTVWYPDLPGCLTCSDTIEGAIVNAQEAKMVWIKAALADGLEIPVPEDEPDLSEFSGQFKLRMPKSLHRSLSINAKKEGISMNQYCIYLLSKNNAAHQAALV